MRVLDPQKQVYAYIYIVALHALTSTGAKVASCPLSGLDATLTRNKCQSGHVPTLAMGYECESVSKWSIGHFQPTYAFFTKSSQLLKVVSWLF